MVANQTEYSKPEKMYVIQLFVGEMLTMRKFQNNMWCAWISKFYTPQNVYKWAKYGFFITNMSGKENPRSENTLSLW